ncbi:MAG: PadR family transcriptional regulator [Opitutales bacterium]|nr:PadR family transcriptional regulator [Opitutales bacterium]
MKKKPKDLLQGTLDLLILRILSAGPRHGYGIARRIEQISEDVLKVQQGSLYPALHRLEDQALVKSEWKSEGDKRPVKIYTLSKAGIDQLEEQTKGWREYSAAVELILTTA